MARLGTRYGKPATTSPAQRVVRRSTSRSTATISRPRTTSPPRSAGETHLLRVPFIRPRIGYNSVASGIFPRRWLLPSGRDYLRFSRPRFSALLCSLGPPLPLIPPLMFRGLLERVNSGSILPLIAISGGGGRMAAVRSNCQLLLQLLSRINGVKLRSTIRHAVVAEAQIPQVCRGLGFYYFERRDHTDSI